MEEARIKKRGNKNEWTITVIKKGVAYTETVYKKKDITEKLLEMTKDDYVEPTL